jgi:hypothetical protein
MSWRILLVGPGLGLALVSWVSLAMIDPTLVAIALALGVSAIVQVERSAEREMRVPVLASACVVRRGRA